MKNLLKSLKNRRERIENKNQLTGWSDHLLRDIGVTRSELILGDRKHFPTR